jgi:Holliday junction resolvasome RuvABC endonuclease subunit
LLILGEDVSSTSTGWVIVDGQELLEVAVWTPPKKADLPRALADFYDAKHDWLDTCKERGLIPEVSIAEELGFTRNHQTVRVLSQFEGVAYLVNQQRGIISRTVKAGTARHHVLGLAVTTSKAEVHALARQRFSHLRFGPDNQGGGDLIDAYVVALAAPEVLRG